MSLNGDSFIIPDTTLEGYSFDGWYLDANFIAIYEHDVVTSDLTLYAKFNKDPYIINFLY